MRLLLDTAALIYAVEAPERLSKKAAAMVRDPENTLELSAVSLVEIAIKSSVGKLRLEPETVRRAIEELGIRVLPFTASVAFALFNLPVLHRDPFDRQIISQALLEDIPVLTSDQVFKRYKGLRVIW
jgi:PIN domain nuclease of toxin-antitoxin system